MKCPRIQKPFWILGLTGLLPLETMFPFVNKNTCFIHPTFNNTKNTKNTKDTRDKNYKNSTNNVNNNNIIPD
tara:strand:+ start:1382 stop:1597 length:216 start_codon:yes stop_codon:yes gene_type:complete